MKFAIFLAGALVWIGMFRTMDFTKRDWPSNVYYLHCWRINIQARHWPPTCEPQLGFAGTNMLTWAYPFFIPGLLSVYLSDRVTFCLYWLLHYTIGFWGACKLFEFEKETK